MSYESPCFLLCFFIMLLRLWCGRAPEPIFKLALPNCLCLLNATNHPYHEVVLSESPAPVTMSLLERLPLYQRRSRRFLLAAGIALQPESLNTDIFPSAILDFQSPEYFTLCNLRSSTSSALLESTAPWFRIHCWWIEGTSGAFKGALDLPLPAKRPLDIQ